MSYAGLGVDEMPVPPAAPAGQAGAGQVSNWRRSMAAPIGGLNAAVTGITGALSDPEKAQAMSPTAQPTLSAWGTFSQWLLDPSKSDADVVGKLAEVREQYRGVRSNLPMPIKSVIDPFADWVTSMVPANLKPPSFGQAIASATCSTPWLMLTAAAVGGAVVGQMLSRGMTSNRRRVHRNRRRRSRR